MKEKESAVDVIFELRDMLAAQQKEIKLLQASLNLISGKVNKTLFPDFTSPQGVPVAAGTIQPVVPDVEDNSHLYQEPAPAPPTPKPVPQQKRNVKVFGHFDDDAGKPLAGVTVRIMDANNNVVKQTKSNRAGLWMSFLPPGEYIAEIIMSGMQPEARQFQLFDGQKEVEVN